MRQKWEYKIFRCMESYKDIIALSLELGQDGWEVFQVTVNQNFSDIFAKRPIDS